MHVWRSEENFWELALSSHLVLRECLLPRSAYAVHQASRPRALDHAPHLPPAPSFPVEVLGSQMHLLSAFYVGFGDLTQVIHQACAFIHWLRCLAGTNIAHLLGSTHIVFHSRCFPQVSRCTLLALILLCVVWTVFPLGNALG